MAEHLTWSRYHFSGTDHNAADNKKAIYRIAKDWCQAVDNENGNYDYLMFANLNYSHPQVIEDVKRWGLWIGKELTIKGMRLDAIKHVGF